MSREEKENLPPDWTRDKISSLRKKLEKNGSWPEKANELLAELNRPEQLSPVGEADFQMLSLVLNDALEGVDITVRYPAFYYKMLADTELRQALWDGLALLSEDAVAESDLFPHEYSHDLNFLQTAVSPPPTIQQTQLNKWHAAFHLLADQLNQLFFPSIQPVFRSSNYLEDASLVLLRRDFTADSKSYDVILEAVTPLETPEQLQLTFLVTPLTDETLPIMNVQLQWGTHQYTAVTDRYGRAHFPLLPLHTILDDTNQTILSDLHLNLEIA